MNGGRSYRLLNVLGEGGFGTVYRAELVASGGFRKEVALKVLRDGARLPPEMAARLRDEARMLGRLRHRAIVGVDSLAELEEGWAVVMEFVDGADLYALLHHHLVPERVTYAILAEVASALHAAHHAVDNDGVALALVHRDIKPGNIRLTAAGDVKVLDFGVAYGEFEGREARTRSIAFGSLRYMAPERLEGIDTPSADVYSLGVVLAEMLVGPDISDPPPGDIQQRAWVASLAARSPHEARELLRAMLAYDREDRPSARSVERALTELARAATGPWLSDWAAEVLPEVTAATAARPIAGDQTTLLLERRQGPAMLDAPTAPAPLPAAPGERPAVPTIRVFGLVGGLVAFFGIVAIAAIAGVVAVSWPLGGSSVPAPEPEAVPAAVAEVSAPAFPAAPGGPPPAPGVEPASPAPGRTSARAVAKPVAAPTEPVVAAPEPPAPAAPPPEPASVRFTGDAHEAWLERDGIRVSPPLAAGTYQVVARFGAASPTPAGRVTLAPGESRTLSCTAAFEECR